jgi:hypothetical protein
LFSRGIAAIGLQVTSERLPGPVSLIDVAVDGESRDLNPVVRDEAYQIAGEALRNAVKHAGARHVTVTIHYESRQLRLTVRDDGKGIDAETLARQQVNGHFGLPGMRERAAIVKGRLEVRSATSGGTQIELRVPATIAYRASGRTSWWSRLRRGPSEPSDPTVHGWRTTPTNGSEDLFTSNEARRAAPDNARAAESTRPRRRPEP